MHAFAEEVAVQASPATIFALYTDVAGWSQWDPDVEHASITGVFAVGTSGTLKPTNGPQVRMRLTEVTHNRSFTDETTLPFCTVRFEHTLTPVGSTTHVRHSVEFAGPLAFFFVRVMGTSLQRGLPHALQRLKALAEQRQNA
jgi:uncharacterized protein YndB with AHSA1/START domain